MAVMVAAGLTATGGREILGIDRLLMDEAKAEVVAFTAFALNHWTKIWSTIRSTESTTRSNDAPASSGSSQSRQHDRLLGAVVKNLHGECVTAGR